MSDEADWGPVQGFTYDPVTGKIYKPDGMECFTTIERGYKKTTLRGRTFYAHRVAWYLFSGRGPAFEIDHINGDRSDNRIENLRDVSHEINNRNVAKTRASSSGITGIYKVKKHSCWMPQVSVGNRSISLGATPCLGIAIKRRRQAEADLGFHANHGRMANG